MSSPSGAETEARRWNYVAAGRWRVRLSACWSRTPDRTETHRQRSKAPRQGQQVIGSEPWSRTFRVHRAHWCSPVAKVAVRRPARAPGARCDGVITHGANVATIPIPPSTAHSLDCKSLIGVVAREAAQRCHGCGLRRIRRATVDVGPYLVEQITMLNNLRGVLGEAQKQSIVRNSTRAVSPSRENLAGLRLMHKEPMRTGAFGGVTCRHR